MKIQKHLIVAALAALISIPAALAAEDGKAKGKGGPFVAADKDGDGKISSAEYVAYATAGGKMTEDAAKKKFADLDTDKDGSLSRQEFRAGMGDMGKKKAEGTEQTQK